MTEEEKVAALNEMFDTTVVKALSVQGVNHRPHMYVIGVSHVSFASDHYGGMLGKEAIREGERRGKCKCSHPNCNVPFDEHTHDTVVFLQLQKNTTQAEMQKATGGAKFGEKLQEWGVDGATFVDTPEKYRVA